MCSIPVSCEDGQNSSSFFFKDGEGTRLACVREESPCIIGIGDNVPVIIGTNGDIPKSSGIEDRWLCVHWSNLYSPNYSWKDADCCSDCWLYGEEARVC